MPKNGWYTFGTFGLVIPPSTVVGAGEESDINAISSLRCNKRVAKKNKFFEEVFRYTVPIVLPAVTTEVSLFPIIGLSIFKVILLQAYHIGP